MSFSDSVIQFTHVAAFISSEMLQKSIKYILKLYFSTLHDYTYFGLALQLKMDY